MKSFRKILDEIDEKGFKFYQSRHEAAILEIIKELDERFPVIQKPQDE